MGYTQIYTAGIDSGHKVLHKLADGAADGAILMLNGRFTTGVLQVTGITTAVITLKGSIDGATWVAIPSTNINSGTDGATIAANGIYKCEVLGLRLFKAEITSHTTGDVNVEGYFIPN